MFGWTRLFNCLLLLALVAPIASAQLEPPVYPEATVEEAFQNVPPWPGSPHGTIIDVVRAIPGGVGPVNIGPQMGAVADAVDANADAIEAVLAEAYANATSAVENASMEAARQVNQTLNRTAALVQCRLDDPGQSWITPPPQDLEGTDPLLEWSDTMIDDFTCVADPPPRTPDAPGVTEGTPASVAPSWFYLYDGDKGQWDSTRAAAASDPSPRPVMPASRDDSGPEDDLILAQSTSTEDPKTPLWPWTLALAIGLVVIAVPVTAVAATSKR